MNFNQLMRQAQQMQKRVNKLKKEFESKEFDFASQQNLVTGKINGKLEIVELNISEDLLEKENKDMLQDLILVTVNDKMKQIIKEKDETLNTATNGVDVTGFM